MFPFHRDFADRFTHTSLEEVVRGRIALLDMTVAQASLGCAGFPRHRRHAVGCHESRDFFEALLAIRRTASATGPGDDGAHRRGQLHGPWGRSHRSRHGHGGAKRSVTSTTSFRPYVRSLQESTGRGHYVSTFSGRPGVDELTDDSSAVRQCASTVWCI